jgi:hypothetical protein
MIYEIEKKNLMVYIINFNRDLISIDTLKNHILNLLKTFNKPQEEFFQEINNKNIKRSLFTKNIYLEYTLIHNDNEKILHKVFFDGNSIYSGKVLVNNHIYHKFLFNKAVRDDLSKIGLEPIEHENFNLLIPDKEKSFGKILYKNNQEYINLLKEKLIEEGLEVLKTKNINDLIEEIGDVYTLLNVIIEKS